MVCAPLDKASLRRKRTTYETLVLPLVMMLHLLVQLKDSEVWYVKLVSKS